MTNAITRADARKWICVFCGAKSGADAKYVEAARETGRAIASRGWGVVFGGGRVGLMAALADAALAAGGEVIGVIPRALMAREPGHPGVSRLEIVVDMAVRKQRMIELADAFVTLPGGLGTLDELFEVLTLRQIGQHAKPVGLYNLDGYFDTLLAACREFVARGFVLPGDIDFLVQESRIEPLLDRLFKA
ncbi:MAG: TIGR00730 family Rossman fold protein [Burkholderiaceae bacterium]|nr:TIGR00730 family Rossman fold protein [Burkholderiaceae bacterium]